jgi:hypothetical protein
LNRPEPEEIAVHSRKLIAVVLVFLTACLVSVHSGAAGITVLIHGWHAGSGVPWWPTTMQSAIAQQHLGGEENFGTITVTGITGSLVQHLRDRGRRWGAKRRLHLQPA